VAARRHSEHQRYVRKCDLGSSRHANREWRGLTLRGKWRLASVSRNARGPCDHETSHHRRLVAGSGAARLGLRLFTRATTSEHGNRAPSLPAREQIPSRSGDAKLFAPQPEPAPPREQNRAQEHLAAYHLHCLYLLHPTRDTSPPLRPYHCPCPAFHFSPGLCTLFMFLGKPNDPVDRLRSEMICCLGWAGREIRKHQRNVRNLKVWAAPEADL